jgi:large subunit ribosomal protein L5
MSAVRTSTEPRLLIKYREEVVPTLIREFAYRNIMQVPKIHKVVVNVGLGEAKDNPRALDSTIESLRAITGQQPIVTYARKSIASFKLRAGMPNGVKVTLRGKRMWYFLDRLINVALPRVRDFRGVGTNFDGRGNYHLGLQEQIVFPEVDYDKIDKIRGLEVSIVTTARTDEEAKKLLELLGMPFRKG